MNKAKAGDTIKVDDGTYREAVRVRGAKKSYLKLVGNPGAPEKVVLKGGGGRQNGVLVDGADEVTVRGFKARDYAANGFFFVNVVGYTARDLIAAKTGVYGIYAFNSKGGTMRDSEAYYNSDAGFYIGQTPAQVKPVRSIVTQRRLVGQPARLERDEHALRDDHGLALLQQRRSGSCPNALDSEKFPPAEDNIIRGNEIFWNNFNFHAGAPFKPKTSGVVPLVPVGTGIALLGGRRNVIEHNQIYGNYTVGAAMVEGFLLEENPQARALVGNVVRDNASDSDGTDLNGRDLAYDGNGSGNCFGGNAGVASVTIPADGSTLAACPFSGANAFSSAAQVELASLPRARPPCRSWIKHPHAPKPGYEPLELYQP